MVYSNAMNDVIYDSRNSLIIAGLEEQGYSRVQPIPHPHPEPMTCGNIFTFTSPPACKNGEMWLYRQGPELQVSKPESDRLICMSCGKQERAR